MVDKKNPVFWAQQIVYPTSVQGVASPEQDDAPSTPHQTKNSPGLTVREHTNWTISSRQKVLSRNDDNEKTHTLAKFAFMLTAARLESAPE
jgi:hypothetical protein